MPPSAWWRRGSARISTSPRPLRTGPGDAHQCTESTGYRLAREQPVLAGDELTIADFAAYAEIGQLRPEFTNVYDFEPFPNVRRWLDDMKGIKAHDEVHVVLTELGDISTEPPDMDTIRSANKQALSTLKASLAALSA